MKKGMLTHDTRVKESTSKGDEEDDDGKSVCEEV